MLDLKYKPDQSLTSPRIATSPASPRSLIFIFYHYVLPRVPFLDDI